MFNDCDCAGPLLPAQQLQPRLQRRRHAEHVDVHRPAAAVAADDRRRALGARITWGYFGEGYDNGTPDPNYCGICDPMQYVDLDHDQPGASAPTSQHGLEDFDAEATNGTLPAVSFLKPGDDDGHPGYSTLAAFEAFVTHAVDEVQNNPSLWKNTAIFVTFDEGGGYYDSGYVQPVSFFGDGTRVPMLVVSPYAKPGYISHTYTDHVSILKFIERNWQLSPLSERSLDNLPNPVSTGGAPYVPTNRRRSATCSTSSTSVTRKRP